MMIYLIFLLFGTAISQDFSCPSGYIGSNSNALNSGANDVIVVTQVDGSFKFTHISVQVGKFHNFWSTVWSREGTEMKIYVNDIRLRQAQYSFKYTDTTMLIY